MKDAQDRLEWLTRHHPSAGTSHELGLVLELQQRCDEAIAHYEHLLKTWPDDSLAYKAGFRRILCLQDIGRYRKARRPLRRLARGELGSVARQRIALVQGVNRIGLGRTRKGVAQIEETLAELENSQELSWHRARSRLALFSVILDAAADVSLQNDKRAARNLPARAELLGSAELQLVKINLQKQVEFTLDGFLLLGDAYMALHDEFLWIRPPPKFDEAQVLAYQAQLELHAERLRKTAWEYYDIGFQTGTRMGSSGPVMDALRTNRENLSGQ